MSTLKELRQRRAELRNAGAAIVTAYQTEDREATGEELDRLTALRGELEEIEGSIQTAEDRAEAERAFGSRQAADAAVREDADPRGGFRHFGEFCAAVVSGSAPGGDIDDRLRVVLGDGRMRAAPTTYGSEGVGSDGGYAVPPEFSGQIRDLSLEEDAFLPLTDNDQLSGNSMTFPTSESTPWGSTGVIAYWEAEAAQATQTKPEIKANTQRLVKLFALVPMTDELIADAAVMGPFVERNAAASIRWKTNDAIMNGTGAGQPLGVQNAGCLVTQAKEGSQSADTIVAANVLKMFARNLNPGRARWTVNPDAWNQLPQMTIGDQPMWVSGGNLESAPAGLLLGRPVMMSDTCATLGDAGDINFIDFMAYHTITKRGGIDVATSIHLWFDYDMMAFRAIFRVNGQPWLSAPVTPPNSAVTRSPCVNLAARA